MATHGFKFSRRALLERPEIHGSLSLQQECRLNTLKFSIMGMAINLSVFLLWVAH
jgi:hypothetical protein